MNRMRPYQEQPSFYVTLPSNVQSHSKEENLCNSYKTTLAQRIELEGDWEVGLSEISYTNSWFNITRPMRIGTAIRGMPEDDQLGVFRITPVLYYIPPGRYDVKTLVSHINDVLRCYISDEKVDVKNAPSLHVVEPTRQVMYMFRGAEPHTHDSQSSTQTPARQQQQQQLRTTRKASGTDNVDDDTDDDDKDEITKTIESDIEAYQRDIDNQQQQQQQQHEETPLERSKRATAIPDTNGGGNANNAGAAPQNKKKEMSAKMKLARTAHLALDKDLAFMLGFRKHGDITNGVVEQVDEQGNTLYIIATRLVLNDDTSNGRFIRHTYINGLISAEQPYDFSNGIHAVYVYSNLCYPQLVGDSQTQLLRTVQIPDTVGFGHQIVNTYTSPIYVPLLMRDISEIEIVLRSDTGESIPFQFGRTIITLHFRRVS